MTFNNEELGKVVEAYAKATGQKFIIDPGVRGRVTILLPEAISQDEAFNQLSSALALNGFAISKQGDTMVIKSARNIQRDLIEVSTQRPSIKPERMYTWIYKPKYLPVTTLARDLRILNSRDGEVSVNASTNQLIFCDWVSNLNRVADLLTELDKPVDASTAKLIEQSRKSQESEPHNRRPKGTQPPTPEQGAPKVETGKSE
jgi:general secretion pathway protein D